MCVTASRRDRLEIRLVDSIPRSANGKFKGVVCDI